MLDVSSRKNRRVHQRDHSMLGCFLPYDESIRRIQGEHFTLLSGKKKAKD